MGPKKSMNRRIDRSDQIRSVIKHVKRAAQTNRETSCRTKHEANIFCSFTSFALHDAAAAAAAAMRTVERRAPGSPRPRAQRR